MARTPPITVVETPECLTATKKPMDSIRRGLEEAVAYAEGKADSKTYKVHVPQTVDIKQSGPSWG